MKRGGMERSGVLQSKKPLFVPIGVKLIGIVSLLLILSLGGMTLLATSYFSTDTERTIKLNTLDRAELISQKIEADLDNYMSIGRIIAASMDGGLVYQGTGGSVTDQLLSQQSDFLGVVIVTGSPLSPDVLKESLNQVRVQSLGINVPETQSLLKTNPGFAGSAFAGVASLANLSPEFGYPVLGLAFPYQMKNPDEAASVVVLTFTMDRLIETLKSRELYRNYLVDSTGTLIADSDQKLDLARPALKNDAIVRAAMTGATQTLQLQFNDEKGERYLGTYQRFFDGRLTTISTVKSDTALAGVYLIQRRNLLITVAILCVSILLLFFFSKTLTIPIRRLVDGTNLIAEGDYSVVIPPKTRDEIGRLAGSFNHMSKGLAEREKIKTVFGKFVNKDVAERAISGELQLGGESLNAAIFFSDIRSFTAISERLSPHEVVEFLNDYMTRMVACVNQTHGIVDKFIGDAIMAVWGVPASHGNDTENAVNGALMMRKALAEFNKGRGGDRSPLIRAGSGINTGEVIAGQIGSIERMEYTCIGDAVNLASRIESLNKPFKTDILISEYSHGLVKDIFRVAPMKKIMVKGKEEPQQIYAVLGRYDDPACPPDIATLRGMLGWESVDLDALDVEGHENKYSIIE